MIAVYGAVALTTDSPACLFIPLLNFKDGSDTPLVLQCANHILILPTNFMRQSAHVTVLKIKIMSAHHSHSTRYNNTLPAVIWWWTTFVNLQSPKSIFAPLCLMWDHSCKQFWQRLQPIVQVNDHDHLLILAKTFGIYTVRYTMRSDLRVEYMISFGYYHVHNVQNMEFLDTNLLAEARHLETLPERSHTTRETREFLPEDNYAARCAQSNAVLQYLLRTSSIFFCFINKPWLQEEISFVIRSFFSITYNISNEWCPAKFIHAFIIIFSDNSFDVV
ncbi:hypothetical protein ALC57_18839 [Trachymyrmex cornetzi]|uniref:Uncharacterized protein n=1 Tax=Trachymyrmex cornetzi TaxID=471704 RepID=A0A195D7N3_9HYME|nr:hypothetical protein ALC57_18839 [Trachymyrmex cornetzi]